MASGLDWVAMAEGIISQRIENRRNQSDSGNKQFRVATSAAGNFLRAGADEWRGNIPSTSL